MGRLASRQRAMRSPTGTNNPNHGIAHDVDRTSVSQCVIDELLNPNPMPTTAAALSPRALLQYPRNLAALASRRWTWL